MEFVFSSQLKQANDFSHKALLPQDHNKERKYSLKLKIHRGHVATGRPMTVSMDGEGRELRHMQLFLGLTSKAGSVYSALKRDTDILLQS